MNEVVKKHYSSNILREACSKFKIKEEDARLIKSNSNLIFDCGNKVLRLSHSKIRTKEDIEAELDWLIYLEKNQLPVVKTVYSIHDANLEQVGSEIDNYFTVVCFEKIRGGRVTEEKWNATHFERLGKITGMLHRVGNQYQEKKGLLYRDWDTIIEFDSYKYLPEDKRALGNLHDRVVAEINKHVKTTHNYGLTHYDIHHGNYLLSEDSKVLTILDFEMICKTWFVNDVAVILYYANHYPKTKNMQGFEASFLASFWQGYEQEYTIDKSEKEWIPLFLIYRDLMLYGFLCNVWKENAELKESEKKYLEMIELSIKKRRNVLGM